MTCGERPWRFERNAESEPLTSHSRFCVPMPKLPTITFPYGQETIQYTIPEHRFNGELVSQLHHYKPEHSQDELVRKALENPIGTPKLSVIAEGKLGNPGASVVAIPDGIGVMVV